MSTFKGIIAEFPQICIDYFRQQPGHKAPLACFLSHVHSDHLTGLESLRAPFVYCSAATREILLRLEKYHYRMNFARGILESRNVTYDKSMRRLAKPLPLDTPTVIELTPGKSIRVTLLDANHCVGAVMFLIEDDGKAVLYTGDIRAELWWVNSIVQNPVILPYTYGTRRLDCIYLDTTFATKSAPYREFPSKADGIRELFQKVDKYPKDTVFYFHSWTFGYENVWIALSGFLNTRIHLDPYRARIYSSLSSLKNKRLKEAGHDIHDAPPLCGYMNGNHFQPGCLTPDSDVRLHSCERGAGCPVVDNDTGSKVVHIIPIINRVNGTEILELGAGGGQGDLDQKEELETGDVADVGKLMELCAEKIDDADLLAKVLEVLQRSLVKGKDTVDLDLGMPKESQESNDELSLQTLVSALTERVAVPAEPGNESIRFPYSRHSSYSELCAIVAALRPKDVYPCTVDEDNWEPCMGMRSLFGEHCSASIFRHDAEMMETYELRLQREKNKHEVDTQRTEEEVDVESPVPAKRAREMPTGSHSQHGAEHASMSGQEAREDITLIAHVEPPIQSPAVEYQSMAAQERPVSPPSVVRQENDRHSGPTVSFDPHPAPSTSVINSSARDISPPRRSRGEKNRKRRTNQQIAYDAALGFGLTWADYGGLVSTRRDEEEVEL
ncbi:hypothetical protein M011DRAFT_395301 [Sporormia fimetaria CBS 119925]|uniref:Protein artemis n=1 Tax=Sporormia fimetaria CBS 119925 TaxID=1340428 RepID=A0A6A6VNJ1_9PLEO|nr:hypothetical protein M011DRAFT_395301 [Sporormia fimetaria CBS 119925]